MYRLAHVLLVSACGIAPAFGQATKDAPKAAPVSILDKVKFEDVPAALKPTAKADNTLAIIGDRQAKLDCAVFSPNGKHLAFGGPGETITVLEFPEFKAVATFKNPETTAVAFSPSGRAFAAADSKGVVRTWKVSGSTFTPNQTIDAHKGGPAWGLTFAPGGQQLVTAGKDGLVKVWDLKQSPPVCTHTLTGHKDTVRAVAVNWDATLVASAGLKDGTVRLWDISDAKGKQTHVETYKDVVTSVTFDPDGKKLAVGVMDGRVRICSTDGGKLKEEKVFRVSKEKIAMLTYSATGDSIGMLGLDATGDRVMVYSVEGKPKFEDQKIDHIESVAFAPDGRHLAVVYERYVHLVRIPNLAPPKK